MQRGVVGWRRQQDLLMLPGAEAVFRAGSRLCAGVGHADSCDTPCACAELSSLRHETTLSSEVSAPSVVPGTEEEAEQSQMYLLGPQESGLELAS